MTKEQVLSLNFYATNLFYEDGETGDSYPSFISFDGDFSTYLNYFVSLSLSMVLS